MLPSPLGFRQRARVRQTLAPSRKPIVHVNALANTKQDAPTAQAQCIALVINWLGR